MKQNTQTMDSGTPIYPPTKRDWFPVFTLFLIAELSFVLLRMALPTSTSCVLSATLAVLTLATMMVFKSQLASKEWLTILGGFLGSQFFIFLVTAVGNFEHLAFGKNFQTKLIPELVSCLMASMFVSGMVHRVCVTTCFIFSSIALYYIVRLSNNKYGPVVKPAAASSKGKKVQ